MTCIKTGCDVYLASQGSVLHGDMFKVGGVYILHHCGMDTMSFGPCAESRCDFAFNDSDHALNEVNCMYLDSEDIIAMAAHLVEEND